MVGWLERRGLTPPTVEAPTDASLFLTRGQFGPWPAELSGAIASLPADAPSEEWPGIRYVGEQLTERRAGAP